jgi:hypothetical protein
MTTVALSIRGLPEWLIRDYLGEMGASPDGDDASPRMAAEGWSVSWSSQRVQIPGSSGIGLTQFDIVFTAADAATLEAVETRFMQKAQRGGG